MNCLKIVPWCVCFCLCVFSSSQAIESKTLVIILSETREYARTYDNFYENVLKPLKADLAVCIGTKPDYPYNNPFFQNATYRFCYPEPDDYATAFDEAYQTITSENPSIERPFYWRHFLKIKDQFLGGIKDDHDQHPGSAGILIFYRWFLLHNILQNDLLDKYDFFVITRSDFIYTLPHPSVLTLTDEFIYVPFGEQYGGVTDRHVVLPKKFVIPYLNMLNKMVTHGEEYYRKMRFRSNWNLESFIKFHLEENSVWDQVRFFPYIMYAVRSEGGTTRWSVGKYSKEHGCYIKYSTEYKAAFDNQLKFLQSNLSIESFYKDMIDHGMTPFKIDHDMTLFKPGSRFLRKGNLWRSR